MSEVGSSSTNRSKKWQSLLPFNTIRSLVRSNSNIKHKRISDPVRPSEYESLKSPATIVPAHTDVIAEEEEDEEDIRQHKHIQSILRERIGSLKKVSLSPTSEVNRNSVDVQIYDQTGGDLLDVSHSTSTCSLLTTACIIVPPAGQTISGESKMENNKQSYTNSNTISTESTASQSKHVSVMPSELFRDSMKPEYNDSFAISSANIEIFHPHNGASVSKIKSGNFAAKPNKRHAMLKQPSDIPSEIEALSKQLSGDEISTSSLRSSLLEFALQEELNKMQEANSDDIYRTEMLQLVEKHKIIVSKQQNEINQLKSLLERERSLNTFLVTSQYPRQSPNTSPQPNSTSTPNSSEIFASPTFSDWASKSVRNKFIPIKISPETEIPIKQFNLLPAYQQNTTDKTSSRSISKNNTNKPISNANNQYNNNNNVSESPRADIPEHHEYTSPKLQLQKNPAGSDSKHTSYYTAEENFLDSFFDSKSSQLLSADGSTSNNNSNNTLDDTLAFSNSLPSIMSTSHIQSPEKKKKLHLSLTDSLSSDFYDDSYTPTLEDFHFISPNTAHTTPELANEFHFKNDILTI